MSRGTEVIPLAGLIEINPKTIVTGKMVPYIGMEDVSEDAQLLRIRSRSRGELSPGQTSFHDGDVLFAKITPCMENGKGAFVAGLGGRVAQGSTEFHVLRARRGVDSRFIYHWTRSRVLRRAAEAMMTGSAGQRRVPTHFFDLFKVPNLGLTEQRRIAEILDTLDAQISNAGALLAKLATIEQGVSAGCKCIQGFYRLQRCPGDELHSK